VDEAPDAGETSTVSSALPLDANLVGEELRSRAAVVSGFAALIADEAVEVSLDVANDHLARLVANVGEMRALVSRWHDAADGVLVDAPLLGLADPGDKQPARKILIVENDEDHFEMVRTLLARPSHDLMWEILRARTLAEAQEVLSTGEPICSLVNLCLPDSAPEEVVSALRGVAPDQPIVVVTGYPENGAGVHAVREGAQDYFIKGSMTADVLDRSLRYAIERSRVKSVLAHQALHDGLTGLPNRTLLMERLNLAVARLERGEGVAALMFVDLDRFKLINDTMGHRVGDQLLVAVGERLRSKVRRADMVARFGGDEFVVLVENLRTPGEIAALAEQLLAIFAQPFACTTGEHWLGASMGVAILDGGVSADVLLANADTAMYRAKETGRSQWALFDDGMHASLLQRMQIEQELALALEAGELVLHYQPLYDARSERFIGTEALLRWDHPTRGHLQPASFLPVAEDSGQIVSIGAWVITQACLQTRGWLDQGVVPQDWITWVNVSTRQLDRPGLEESVAAALAMSRLPARNLGLEITESALLQDEDRASAMTGRLSALGVRLAVDDFGTGYSSMRRLRELPLNHLKIDGSFVAGMTTEAADLAIVRACVDLAHAMGMTPVAEGVETAEQLSALTDIGCHLTQGFWHGFPQSPADLKALLLGEDDFAQGGHR
jgi:diguanylate cyclase (GGDEF)-like protein